MLRMQAGKGGSDTAFPFFAFLLAVAAASAVPTVSQAYPLALLRCSVLLSAIFLALRAGREGIRVSPFALLTAGFSLLALGHAFSSVYFWVSFQHAVNITCAALFLGAVHLLVRDDPEKAWRRTLVLVGSIAAAELALALFQRLGGGVQRPPGTFGNANYLSEFLASGALLLLAGALWDDGKNARGRFLAGAAAAVLLAGALTLASSRAVLLAAIPAAGLLAVLRYGGRRGAAILGFVLLPGLLVLGLPAIARFQAADLYNYSRVGIWKAALETFYRNPFGVGLGGFKYYWPTFQHPATDAFRHYFKMAENAHCEYLEVLSGLGAIGFGLFLAVLLSPLAHAARKIGQLSGERRAIASGALACLLLSGLNALVNANFHEPGIVFLDAWLLGLLLAVLPQPPGGGIVLPKWVLRTGAVLFALLLACSAATVAAVALHQSGEARMRRGEFAAAGERFRSAARIDPYRAVYPDAVSAALYREYRKGGAGSVEGATVLLPEVYEWERSASALSPRDSAYHARMADICFERYMILGKRGDLVGASYMNRRALALNPFSVERLWRHADLLEASGRRPAAVEALERAVGIEPNFCRGYGRLAAMLERENPAAAAGWASKAGECRVRSERFELTPSEAWMVGEEDRSGGK